MDSNQRNKTGYSVEELYFEKVNRELIQKLKSQSQRSSADQSGPLAEVIPFPKRPGAQPEQTSEDEKKSA